jgi:phosphate-selective porin OprO/OprP
MTWLLCITLLIAGAPAAATQAPTSTIPPEVLQQLQSLAQRVQQLEEQVQRQQQQLAAQHAQQPTVIANADEVSELKRRVMIMERKQQVAEQELAERKKTEPVVLAGDNGFGLRSADGDFEIKLRGLIQGDMRSFSSGIKGQHAYMGDTLAQQQAANDATRSAMDNFLMRRVRPTIDVKFNDIYSARITPEFGSGSTASNNIVDAYVDAKFDDAYKFRVGKFTPGLSLYRLQSSSATKFNELGLGANFLPSRDIGAQVSGGLFNKTLHYSAGIFNGANDGANGNDDSNTDKEIVARLFASPFANTSGALKGLGFGVGISKTDARGTNGSTSLTSYKTFGQESFFSYSKDASATNTVFADGERTRIVPQFSYYNGSLGLTGEYVLEQQDVTRIFGTTPSDRRTGSMQNNGWDITASYLLTGEKASYGGVKPNKPFDPANGGWGAWEIALSLGQLDIDDDAFRGANGAIGSADAFAQGTQSAKQAQNYALGVNWYLNKTLRLSLDYSDTRFDWGGGGTATNPDDRESERVLVGRVQASF